MRIRMKPLLVPLVTLALGSRGLANDTAQMQAPAKPLMVALSDLEWSALPDRPGQVSVLSGDPKVGPYTQIRKVPGGTANPRHAHSSDITNVVISGTWYTGVDSASARDFGPGSVVFMPGNWAHVSGCRAGSECVLYQDGKGKFDFKPAN
jgi:hypothetical protein